MGANSFNINHLYQEHWGNLCNYSTNPFYLVWPKNSSQVQARSILAALCQAPVPWSPTITELAEKGKKLEHSLAEKIKEEHSIVPLKTVLRHYNIHVFDLNDMHLMDCIIRNILKVRPSIGWSCRRIHVEYICSNKQPSASKMHSQWHMLQMQYPKMMFAPPTLQALCVVTSVIWL